MRIAVGSDHAGFIQKDPIIEHIKSLGHEVLDFGPANDDRVDYPDFADKVARAVAAGKADCGVLICGTGIGIAMTADKVPGIRATPVQTVQFAELAREHNNAQVVAVGGRQHSKEEALEIIKVFLATPWTNEERHARRIGQLAEYEQTGDIAGKQIDAA